MTQVPEELLAGDTWSWSRDLADYPAGTWTAVWYFEKGDASFSVSGSVSGTAHVGSVSAATSATYRAGKYRWRLVLTSGATRKSPEEGWLDVLPDPAAAGNVDHRSTPQIVVDAIDAYLRDPTNINAASYSLGGRSLSRWSRRDLTEERDYWQAKIDSDNAKARQAAGLGNPRRLKVRFDRAS